MLPTLTLQLDDFKGGFAAQNGTATYDQPAGIDLAGPDGAVATSFAALLPAPDAPVLPVAGGALLPEGGNGLPAGEISVPVERAPPDDELLLAEINNPTSLELRLFSGQQTRADTLSREASLAGLATSPPKPMSMDDTQRAAFRRDNYDLVFGRNGTMQQPMVGTDNPLEIRSVAEQGMRVPTLWTDAGEWTALRESAVSALDSLNQTIGQTAGQGIGQGIGDSGSAIPAALKALQANVQVGAQPLGASPAPQIATPTTASAATMTIGTPVQDGAWSDALSQRVTLLAGGQQTTAEIRLTPAELGPIRVSVAVDDGAANVTFSAQHSVTREAIESALPRLRELLTESGLSLGEASVSDQSTRQGQESERALHENLVGATEAADADERAPAQPVRAALGLVDTFV